MPRRRLVSMRSIRGSRARRSTGRQSALAMKRDVLLRLFGPERARLQRSLEAIGESGGDDMPTQLFEALDELLVRLPVYRTYVEPGTGGLEADDRRFVEAAAAATVASRPDLTASVTRLTDLLLLRSPGDSERAAEFIGRFQQTSGPLMAKGVEDTAFYVYSAFIALNDVGGVPSRFGISPAAFHDDCTRRQRLWPTGMLATFHKHMVAPHLVEQLRAAVYTFNVSHEEVQQAKFGKAYRSTFTPLALTRCVVGDNSNPSTRTVSSLICGVRRRNTARIRAISSRGEKGFVM